MQLNDLEKTTTCKNKEYRQMRCKQYNIDNKEYLYNYRKVKITCECGSTYSRVGKSRHNATHKHIIHFLEKIHMDNILTIDCTKETLNIWGNILYQI